MSGFGRKGVGLSAPAGSAPASAEPAGADLRVLHNSVRGGAIVRPDWPPAGNDELARKREAFLAAERARPKHEGGLSPAAEGFAAVRPQRSLSTAYVLWFFFGQLSAHRFYLGAFQSGAIQVSCWLFALALILSGSFVPGLVVGGFWSLWLFADVFLIRGLHRQLCHQPNVGLVFA